MPRARLIAIVALSALVIAIVRITVAPISIPITGMLERIAMERMGAELSIGRVGVRLGAGLLVLSIEDLRLRAPHLSATVDSIKVEQHFGGRVVKVNGGAMQIDPSGERDGPPALPRPGDALAMLDKGLAGLRAALLEQGVKRVTMTDGRIDLIAAGRPINEARVFQDVGASVRASDEGLKVTAGAVGGSGPIAVNLDFEKQPAGNAFELSVEGLVPRDLARMPPLQKGFVLAVNMSASVPADEPPKARATIGISGGTIVMRNDPPRQFDGGRIDLALAPDGNTIEVLPSEFRAGMSTLTLAGDITAGAAPQDPWTFSLNAPYALLHSADLEKTPVDLTGATLTGRIDMAEGVIAVDAFHADTETGRADAVFSVDIHEGKPWFAMAAQIGQSSINTLLGAWPTIAAYEPRKAIANVVKGGIVKRGDVMLAFTPLEMDPDPQTHSDLEGTLAIDFEFLDTTLTTPELPVAIQRAHGALRMRDRVLSVRIDGGEITTDGHGTLKVLEGAFTIPELAARPAEASISATVEGPLSAVVALAHTLDLSEIKKTPLQPDDVTGTVRAKVAMRTPLKDNVPMEERQWSIDAQLSGAGTTVAVGGQRFSDADVEVLVNSRRLAARGKATIDGIRVDVNYSEVFRGSKTGAARFVLTDRDRRERGFDTGTALTGPVVVTVEAGEDDEKSFSVDLAQAAIDLPGFTKKKGGPLQANGFFSGAGANINVDELRLEGSGASLQGSMALAGGGLARADFENVALSQGDKADVKIRRDGVGYNIDISASVFDARRLIHSAMSNDGDAAKPKPKSNQSGPPVVASATATRLRLSEDTYATDVAISASHTGKSLSRLSVSGRLDGINAGSFAARVAPGDNGSRDIQVDITELGRMLGAVDVYERMRGGRTRMTAQMTPDGAMVGRVVVEDFSLTDETTLEAIIQRTQERARRSGGAGSPTALSVPEGNAMTFDRLTIDFDKRGDTVTIREAVLRGPVIGGTADGVIDLGTKTMRLNGTFIPAYGVNNLFGRVPVLGQILGGGDQGGLIGVTFRFAGPLDKPALTLNPLSAVAPGIFRKIFEYR
ncbi:hypothetical protein DLJ53_15365 [Acuticoccus sediminis]|uniref:DUF3971 domain-containing protein n=1 Tax=Acuticoccus sediminis TaxID=2184697 RepID=A0A8B2NTQ5_9HYPH|nr:AsmA-like C-terminal region-containing protein [Acuticoccus sediminis]RAI00635.1 hypothetical protein DLJ53_15365 [Acuticoccus sediminis]